MDAPIGKHTKKLEKLGDGSLLRLIKILKRDEQAAVIIDGEKVIFKRVKP